MTILRSFLFASACAAALAAPAAAIAQTESQSQSEASSANGGGLSEIIVTARRKAETLLDVPVAVTAVNAETLQRANVNSLEAISTLIPNVTIQRVGAGQGGFLSIRGIASTPQDSGAQQSVLSNVDNVLIGRGRLATLTMFDIAQVEVLKGPQALYYGKNTTAGVISVTSANPTGDFGGYVRAGYEFEARQRYIDGAIDFPVNEELDVRLAGRVSKQRGWVYNAAQSRPYPTTPPPGGTTNPFQPWLNAGVTTAPGASDRWGPSDEDVAGRITLAYKPSSDFSAVLKYAYAQSKAGGGDELYLPYCISSLPGFISYGYLDPNSDCKRDFRVSAGDLPKQLTVGAPLLRDGVPYSVTRGHLASLNIDYQINDVLSLSAITGYYNVFYQGSSNFSPAYLAGVFTAQRDKASGISQEIRLSSDFDSPVNFEFGGFADRLTSDGLGNAIISPSAPDPATGRFTWYNRLIESSSKSISAFGRINWDIVEQLTLSAGVRYTHYKLDSTDGNEYVSALAPAGFFRPQGDYFVRSYSDNNYSPEVTLTYQPDSNQTLYFAYKTGYKSGGFSYPSVLRASYTPANTTFKPERASSFEAGYKAELFDRKLRVDLSAYRTTVTDQQLSTFDSQAFAFFVTNAGKSRVQGVELQLTARPVEGLQLNAAVGYNDGKYVSFPAAQCAAFPVPPAGCTQNLSGKTLPRAPKWAGNFGGSYEIPAGSDLKVTLSGLGNFSSSYNTIDTLDANAVQDAFVLWDAGIAIGDADDRWQLSLQGRNLSDKYITTYSYDASRAAPGTYISVPQRGRQIALEGKFNF